MVPLPVQRWAYSAPPLFSTVSVNEDLLPGIAAIDSDNENLLAKLEVLRGKAYFRLYSVDILASCEYIPQEYFECSSTCEIYPVDDDEVRSDGTTEART